jgi:hypothetical protein
MYSNMYSNRFKVLEIPQDPTDYDDFEDIAPYNLLEDGKWTSLWMNRHPLYYKIRNRFDDDYDGKLLWSELDKMKEKIEKLKKARMEYNRSTLKKESELHSLIIEQTRLCKENNVENIIDTILFSIGSEKETSFTESDTPLLGFSTQVNDANMISSDIISFLPIQTCAQKLQKHLDTCTGGCKKYFVCYECQFKENGRCSHYYEIERAKEELEMYEYYDNEDKSEIDILEYKYERALAVKENRIEEYRQNLYDEFD